ncbi:flagellar biosynthesis protein FlhB [Chitinimonas lacunae]|uniref:Flagellar biosynthetic protein FlhB n=1 Tax=Chitinimonas lacunae TaxID=1963018 RepID=A0ABV8MK62_9NEIS
MAEDSDLERTEDPSPRRLDEARARGQVPRSQELITFSVLVAGMGSLIVSGDSLLDALKRTMHSNLRFEAATLVNLDVMLIRLAQSAYDLLQTLLPLLGACVVASVLASLMISGWIFTFEPLQPKFDRLNPLSGIGRLFSVRALVEGGKAVLKSSLIGGVAVAAIWYYKDTVLQLIALPPLTGLAMLWELTRTILLYVIGAMLLIVLIDVPYQLWDYKRGLKMTKEEVRQEAKESEGDPHVKGRIRQLQMQAARRRMMAEIPKASVVVTNPTHFAVALRYEEGKTKAPQVVAKGSALLAQRIIEVGREHQVPVLRAPPLARALYHHTELGDEIPAALYSAVAEVLAYLYQLDHWQRHGGAEPALPGDLPVPPDLDPGGDE